MTWIDAGMHLSLAAVASILSMMCYKGDFNYD